MSGAGDEQVGDRSMPRVGLAKQLGPRNQAEELVFEMPGLMEVTCQSVEVMA